MKPLISIITPNYNYGHFLSQLIKNVQQQTFPDWELIIVDYGSNDQSNKILQKLLPQDNRLKTFFISAPNQAVATEFGCWQSRGRYLIRHDADDLWDKEFLTEFYKIIKQNPEAELIFCDARIINKKKEITVPSFIQYHCRKGKILSSLKKEDVLAELIMNNFIPTSGSLFQRQAWLESGGFLPHRHFEDYNLWLKIAARKNFIYLPQVLFSYYSHNQGLSHDNWENKLPDLIAAYRHCPQFSPPHLNKLKYNKLYSLTLALARIKLKEIKLTATIKLLGQALSWQIRKIKTI